MMLRLTIYLRSSMKPTYSTLTRGLAARRNSNTNKPSKSCSRGLARWKSGGTRLRKISSLLQPWRTLDLFLQACVLSMGPKPLAQFQSAPLTSLSISLTRVTLEHAGQSISASSQMPQYPICWCWTGWPPNQCGDCESTPTNHFWSRRS